MTHPLDEIAVQLDRSADLLLRLSSAIERLDKRDKIEELREEVRALSNRIASVQAYGFKTRELVAEHIENDAP